MTADDAKGRLNLALFLGSLEGGGAQRIACLLANVWTQAGHGVTVFHHDPVSNAFPFEQSEAITMRRLPLNLPVKNRWRAILRFFKDARTLRKALVAPRFDAVVSFLPQANVLALLACTGTGLPLVVTELCHPAHDAIGRVWGPLRKLAYPRASAFVVQTRDIQDWFRTHNNIVPTLISNPIPRPGASRGLKPPGSRKTIVAAARLTPQKNLTDLVRAFVRLAGKHPDWDLHVYGLGEELEQLQQIINDNDLKERILLPGWTDQLSRRLAEADMFVLSSRFEGMPMALAEAMSLGVPCVSTDCPSGPADYIIPEENGLLVPVEDLDALTGAMDRLMSDPELRDRLGRRARDISTRFSLEEVLAAWDGCLREAMSKKQKRPVR